MRGSEAAIPKVKDTDGNGPRPGVGEIDLQHVAGRADSHAGDIGDRDDQAGLGRAGCERGAGQRQQQGSRSRPRRQRGRERMGSSSG